MYDFFLGDKETIAQNEFEFLVSIKRMLPRYLNSLPDPSFRFIHNTVEKYVKVDKPVFVETGIGSSTILLLHHAMKTGGRLISWDMSSMKASALHQVFSETICKYHGKAVSEYWTIVPTDTTSKYTGTSILPELTNKVDFSIHDSNHTWETISHEVLSVLKLMSEGSVVCVDDANQTAAHTYEPIINITRKKLGLKPIDPIAGNEGKPHYTRLNELYTQYFTDFSELKLEAPNYNDDVYYQWYSTDRKSMNSVGMERFNDLSKRFVAHQMLKRK